MALQFRADRDLQPADQRSSHGDIADIGSNICNHHAIEGDGPLNQTLQLQHRTTSALEGLNHSNYRKRKKGGRTGPHYRNAPGEPNAITRAIQSAPSRPSQAVFYPALGTPFNSCEEGKEFYNFYSWEIGFGIRTGKSRSNSNSYQVWQDYVCTCEGFARNTNAASSRTGCGAHIRLHRSEDDGWFISKMSVEHNHPLSEGYHEKKQWRSHGDIDPCTKNFVKNLRDNNVNLGKVCSILNCRASIESMPPYRKGVVKSLCSRLASDKMKDDIGKTVELLEELRKSDASFAVALDIDNNGTIKNMMWCSGKNKMDYSTFGDAVTFDTTYRTNLYKMPFGLFVGVNNHFQSVVFAGVLMTRETTEAFEWVFSTFPRLMENAPPKTILTDQASAMETAIRSTWKTTHHRWCRWHVLRNAKSKIGKKYSKFSGFKRKFNWLVSAVMDADEFESQWAALIKKYKLSKNKFLKRIFKKRHRWVKSYFLGVFCAGMTSTQRSESANHMLKGHIPREAPMHLFVRKYKNFLEQRNADEGVENHATKQRSRALKIGVPIELHAKGVYTRAMYNKFEEQLFKSGSFAVQAPTHENKYIVRHAIRGGKNYIVSLHLELSEIRCSCGYMEHIGMPCCHALKVLVHNDMLEIPSSNILKRWTTTAGAPMQCSTNISEARTSIRNSESFMHDALWMAARNLVEKGKENWSAFDTAMTILQNGGQEVEEVAIKTKESSAPTLKAPKHHTTDSFIEVFQNNTQLDKIPPNLSCPVRRVRSGAPNSSNLKSWQAQSRKKGKTAHKCSPVRAVAEMDEYSPTVKIKPLCELGCVSNPNSKKM